MFAFHRRLFSLVLLLVLLAPAAASAEILTEEGLDQVLAPIALYPDSLLGNVLVGATYPEQIVEADQWARSHPNTPPDQVESTLQGKGWDPSVVALVSVPDVLGMMAGDMNWTVTLGTAFVDQTDAVYDSIQRLRAQAQSTGALQSTEQVDVVTDDSGYVIIGSSDPDYVYVPTYEPAYVYGWAPGTVALAWGAAAIARGIWYGSCWNWANHHMYCGAGYGSCGYWGGQVNLFSGNTINIDNTRINNIRNNVNNDIRNNRQNWRPGTKPGGGRWDGSNGWDRPGQGPGDRPGAGRPGSDRPGADRPGAGRPGADRPGASRPGTDRPGAGTRPGSDRPVAGPRPAGDRPGASTRPGSSPVGSWSPGSRPSTRPTFDPGRLGGSGSSVFGQGSGSGARRDSARGSRSRSSSPYGGGTYNRSTGRGGCTSGGSRSGGARSGGGRSGGGSYGGGGRSGGGSRGGGGGGRAGGGRGGGRR